MEGAKAAPAGKDIGGKMDSEKTKDIRSTNIIAAKAVADVVRTSLGPRGMDKMI
jgi:T-complex protein 1 subunit delta